MTPYYADGSVTLYHGDCREIPEWLEADVLVTDPPYGMAYESNRNRDKRNVKVGRAVKSDTDTSVRDDALAAWGERPALVFGRWNVPRPGATRIRLVWDKRVQGMGALDLPWGPTDEEIYVLGRGFTGHRASNVLSIQMLNSADAARPDHPTPKPVGLMERLVEKTIGVVADPFAGSGATLVAARNLGRRVIGVEIEERYCDLIASRLAQGDLFGGVRGTGDGPVYADTEQDLDERTYVAKLFGKAERAQSPTLGEVARGQHQPPHSLAPQIGGTHRIGSNYCGPCGGGMCEEAL